MPTTSKILIRKIVKQLATFLATVFIVALAISFFVAVKTVYLQFGSAGTDYFKTNLLSDITFYGYFTESDAKEVADIPGVEIAEARHRFDGIVENTGTDAIIFGRATNSDWINKPYIEEGSINLYSNQLRINKKYADYYGLKLGDELTLDINNMTNTFTIASLASFPNYLFLSKDNSPVISDVKDLAIIEINDEYFEKRHIPYNIIAVRYDSDVVDTDAIKADIENKLGKRIYVGITKEQTFSYSNYTQTLSEIDAFSYIMPIILLTMAGLLLYVIQRRNVTVDRKQIGIMKAVGLEDGSILFMYIRYSFLVSFLGIALAVGIFELLAPFIFRSLESLFDLPNFHVVRYISLWLISASIILAVAVLSNLLAAISILNMNPAQSIRGEAPKGGKKLLIENFKWWDNLSFNTRYSVKTAFRGKTRYLASLWGMFAAVGITVFAQGFNDTFSYLIDRLYNNFVKYDYDIVLNNTNIDTTPSFITSNTNIITHYDKVSRYQGQVIYTNKSDKVNTVDNLVLIYENGFSSLLIPEDENYNDGIMLSDSIARRLNVKEGDILSLEIYIPDKANEAKNVRVNKLIEQSGMFYIYIEREFAKRVFDIPDTYNTIYLSGDDEKLALVLKDAKDIVSYTAKQTLENSSKEQISTIRILIQILVIIAFLLAVAALYSIGVVTLETRRYEFTLLKVMGYSTREILLASIKETVSQIIIATPLGMLAGYFLLQLIKEGFSSDFFDFLPKVYTVSYFIAFGLLLLAVVFVTFMSAKYIDDIDMVEGLKDRED